MNNVSRVLSPPPFSLSISRRGRGRSSLPQFSFHVGWTKLEKVTRPRKCNRRSALPSNLVKITFRIITTACAFPRTKVWLKFRKVAGDRREIRGRDDSVESGEGEGEGRSGGREGHENIKF